jgi:hypothetical protein
MNAIVPLNITALRVNQNDKTNIVSRFKGRTAVFEKIPYGSQTGASTGNTIVQPLDSDASPANPLGAGVHLHWALPDYFKRGVQPAQGGDVVFPHAPNRWLITRYLSEYDSATHTYSTASAKSFIVESDYVTPNLEADAYGVVRPAVSVPLVFENIKQDPAKSAYVGQPFMYMGRVINYDMWNPASESPDDFLPAYNGSDGKPLYLNSIGFVGPGFSAYYPDCSSVFGFWDHFMDQPTIFNAIASNTPIQFKVSYQVTGWINEQQEDPLNTIAALVTNQYNQYVQDCIDENVEVKQTPADVFESISETQFRWTFNTADITYTLNSDKTLDTLTVPQSTLSSGIFQELVWNMENNPSTTFFLENPDNHQDPSEWTDTVKLAAGNTVIEALSALLKEDLANQGLPDPAVLTNYEYLLDALQLGLLNNLDNETDKLITLEESLHSRAFSQISGGKLWLIEQKEQDPNQPHNADIEITLPLEVAEKLHLFNQAQKNYDQARAALDVQRKQLFMDWLHYVNMYAGGVQGPYVDINTLSSFLYTTQGGEINAVIQAGEEAGILFYEQDPVSGQVTAPKQPSGSGSLADEVWTQYQAILQELSQYPQWQLASAPAPSFWLPTDPVVIMEGDRIEPAVRNGRSQNLFVRLSTEIISQLNLTYDSTDFTVFVTNLMNIPTVTAVTPMQSDVQALVGEAFFTVPSLASYVGQALKNKGGANNPAVSSLDSFISTLENAEGGLSPLESATSAGLFAAVQAADYTPAANPQQCVSSPLVIDFTFTNPATNGWPLNTIGWNTQQHYPEFTANRYDPFLPTFLLWTAELDSLAPKNGTDYDAQNLTDYFQLDTDAVDYQYTVNGGTPVPFTRGNNLGYDSSVVLSTKSTYSLTQQVDTYVTNYPSDPNDQLLEDISTFYNKRKILSQSISGFNLEQNLKAFIPQIKVQDLTRGSRDQITTILNQSATANPEDDWYDFGFNSQSPIATGPLAQGNFGPLRSGFMEVKSLEIIDVFGQIMTLNTSSQTADGALQTTPSIPLQPVSTDTVNKEKIFLPPRLLTPTRLWFRWLSASFDPGVSGITTDFVEMNTHPATSPVCGWILPNHLDILLFFYDADGSPIGSFGLEHNTLKYRTRPGNPANISDSLAEDIGPSGSPTVNAHTANFMWYIDGNDADFLIDLMAAIENSNHFINPASQSQSASLSVLVGRPLAITRAVLGLETAGNILPISQADVSATSAFPQDVNNNRYQYSDRQNHSSSDLASVKFPLRMGDLANINDGLVGYLLESNGANPYTTLYSPAAVGSGGHNVEQPDADTIELTLNAPSINVTMLVDPRAPVHATTGILPVQELEIPSDQYEQAMRSLSMVFFTHPVLQATSGLTLPLPLESGYDWSWINPGSATLTPLKSNAGNEYAVYSYTPQTILEGWVQLLLSDDGSTSADDSEDENKE